MRQSRRMSAIESASNVVVGVTLALVLNATVPGLFGGHISVGGNLTLAGLMTVASFGRQFALRRLFERWRA